MEMKNMWFLLQDVQKQKERCVKRHNVDISDVFTGPPFKVVCCIGKVWDLGSKSVFN